MGIAFLHLPEMGAVEGKNKDVQKFLYQEKQYFFLESLKMRRLTRPSVPGDLQGYRIKREKIYPEAKVLPTGRIPAKPQTGHLVMSFFQTASTSCAMDIPVKRALKL